MYGLSRRLAVVIAAVVVLGGASYAFLAALSGLPTGTHAGAAQVSVSGYTVSNLTYSYNAGNPDNIDQVSFELDNDAGVVHLQLVGSGTWYACSKDAVATALLVAPATSWDCDTTVGTQATVTAQDEIDIVAHS
jgi:hypothetical protein